MRFFLKRVLLSTYVVLHCLTTPTLTFCLPVRELIMMKIRMSPFWRGMIKLVGEIEIFYKIGDFPVPEPEIFAIFIIFRGFYQF